MHRIGERICKIEGPLPVEGDCYRYRTESKRKLLHCSARNRSTKWIKRLQIVMQTIPRGRILDSRKLPAFMLAVYIYFT